MKTLITALTFLALASAPRAFAGTTASGDFRLTGSGAYSAKESSSAIAMILFSATPTFETANDAPKMNVDVAINKKQSTMSVTLTSAAGEQKPRTLKCDLFTTTSEATTVHEIQKTSLKYSNTVLRGLCENLDGKGRRQEVLVSSGPQSFSVILTEDAGHGNSPVEIIYGREGMKVATSTAAPVLSGVIISADGEFTGNHPAPYVAKILVPVAPQYGDSDISVRTEVKINGDQLYIAVDGPTPVGRPVAIRLQCGLFKVTQQKDILYVTKKLQTPELQNGGISDETVIRASCVDARQPSVKFSALMNYDSDGYTLIIDRGDLKRFDVIIGQMPQK